MCKTTLSRRTNQSTNQKTTTTNAHAVYYIHYHQKKRKRKRKQQQQRQRHKLYDVHDIKKIRVIPYSFKENKKKK